MLTRRYRETAAVAVSYARAAAGEIACEVVSTGKSEGWCGTVEEREAVAAILLPFNVHYVDDMRGGWARMSGDVRTRLYELGTVDGGVETTTVGEYLAHNECVRGTDEEKAIRSLDVGEKYEGGGGAAPTYYVKRLT